MCCNELLFVKCPFFFFFLLLTILYVPCLVSSFSQSPKACEGSVFSSVFFNHFLAIHPSRSQNHPITSPSSCSLSSHGGSNYTSLLQQLWMHCLSSGLHKITTAPSHCKPHPPKPVTTTTLSSNVGLG